MIMIETTYSIYAPHFENTSSFTILIQVKLCKRKAAVADADVLQQ
jgi:hypothetical protein